MNELKIFYESTIEYLSMRKPSEKFVLGGCFSLIIMLLVVIIDMFVALPFVLIILPWILGTAFLIVGASKNSDELDEALKERFKSDKFKKEVV